MSALPAFDVTTARAVGEDCAQSCLGKAERDAPGFSEAARDFVLRYLRTHGPTPGENIVDAAIECGLVPHDARAFGGVFSGLARRKEIAVKGDCKRKKGHGTHGGVVWGIAE